MIDIHAHILYGIDDGASSLEDSKKILDAAIENGVKGIVFTPHYILESKYLTNNKVKEEIFKKIKRLYSKKIDLYLGNEIYINNDIDELVLNGEISPLASSKYLLIELPVYNEYPALEKYLFELRDKGYKIIIAHPERYYYFKNDFSKFIKLVRQGIYFQGNYMSLYDTYGKSTRRLFLKILKYRGYSFISSDIHKPGQDYYSRLRESKERISKLTDTNYMEDIFYNNPLKIIKNEKIEVSLKERVGLLNKIRGKI